MSIKNIFSSNRLKPYYRFSQDGNIWRLFFNNSNIIAGETRDIKTKQAYIFSFDFVQKKQLVKNLQFKEKWWFAIDAVNDKYIFVSSFKNPEVPEHRGFEAIDIRSGNKIWDNDELEFFFADNEHVFAVKQLFESKIIYKLDTNDGSIIVEYKNEDELLSVIELKKVNGINTYRGLINTDIMDMDDVILKSRFNEIIEKLKASNLTGAVEYINSNDYLVLNYHSSSGVNLKNLNENLLTNKMEIYDKENNLIFEDILNQETSSYVPDSFFVKEGYLFHIKEKSELICINLNN